MHSSPRPKVSIIPNPSPYVVLCTVYRLYKKLFLVRYEHAKSQI